MKYSSINHTSFRGKEVNSTYRRKSKPIHREDIGSQIDLRLLGKQLQPIIEESLRECGKANYRKGTILTPLFTVFVVLGLAMRRDLSYPHVINWLVSGLRWLTCCLPAKVVEDGALSHARKRLGIEVFRRIFQKMAAHQDTLVKDFHGLTSAAFDGTSATLADTPSNRERFGLPKADAAPAGTRSYVRSRCCCYPYGGWPISPTLPTRAKAAVKEAS
jgi:hypothetical protein